MIHRLIGTPTGVVLALWFCAVVHNSNAEAKAGPLSDVISTQSLAGQLAVGDIVFIRVSAKPFREIAAATNSWTNHVGIVVDNSGREPLVGESAIPWSRTTLLSRFIARSEKGRVAVMRLKSPLSEDQRRRIPEAAHRHAGVLYDTGFDLHSHREFCSRYVREVVQEATGTELGDVATFASLLRGHPEANLGFWKLWFFGRIPWDRETVTPASLLQSSQLDAVFDGTVTR